MEKCLLNPCNVVAQLVTSQPVTVDTTLPFISHTDVLGPSRISRKQLASTMHSAHFHVLRGFPFLQICTFPSSLETRVDGLCQGTGACFWILRGIMVHRCSRCDLAGFASRSRCWRCLIYCLIYWKETTAYKNDLHFLPKEIDDDVSKTHSLRHSMSPLRNKRAPGKLILPLRSLDSSLRKT